MGVFCERSHFRPVAYYVLVRWTCTTPSLRLGRRRRGEKELRSTMANAPRDDTLQTTCATKGCPFVPESCVHRRQTIDRALDDRENECRTLSTLAQTQPEAGLDCSAAPRVAKTKNPGACATLLLLWTRRPFRREGLDGHSQMCAGFARATVPSLGGPSQ
jgi:hypothetical protein